MSKKKYISTPERLWSLFIEYKNNTKGNPILVQDYLGKDGKEVFRRKERCLTLDGFENYVADKGIIQDLGDYFSNKGGNYSKYSTICSRVRRVIRQDQIEGGMAGIYNASITQRLNNLKENTETTFVEQPLFGNAPQE